MASTKVNQPIFERTVRKNVDLWNPTGSEGWSPHGMRYAPWFLDMVEPSEAKVNENCHHNHAPDSALESQRNL